MFVLFVFCQTVSSFRAGRVTTVHSSGVPGTQQMLAEVGGADKGMLMKLLLDHVLHIFYLPNQT